MQYRALVLDDSIVFRKVMARILAGFESITAVDMAATGSSGLEMIRRGRYDLLFLDMILPDCNGLEILDRLNDLVRPPRVIVVSGAGERNVGLTIQALERGAMEFIRKPKGTSFGESVNILTRDIGKALTILENSEGFGASSCPVPHSHRQIPPPGVPATVLNTGSRGGGFGITAMAVSTGGPVALARVIPALPEDYPTPILIVQHMPAGFTTSLAQSLDRKSALKVVEAEDGMILEKGTVFLAPGGRHMVVESVSGRLGIGLNDDEPECNVRPAADVLFRSISRLQPHHNVLAVIMTGMGEDGSRGVERLKRGPCYCLAQSRASCVVHGMPRAIVERGLADEVVPLDRLAERMMTLTASKVRMV